VTERAQVLAFKPGVSVLGCFGFNSLHSRCSPSIRAGKLAPSAEPLSNDGRCWNKRESASVETLRHPPRAMSLRADRPFKKKIIQCEAADVVAQARAAESIGISFQNPLALAMGRFRSFEKSCILIGLCKSEGPTRCESLSRCSEELTFMPNAAREIVPIIGKVTNEWPVLTFGAPTSRFVGEIAV
jgi:hypothetical protein